MKTNFILNLTIIVLLASVLLSCNNEKKRTETTLKGESIGLEAKDIIGNPNYLAISYGGYRQNTRDEQPSIEELKEDLKILAALKVKILRTYNTHLPHASNVLEAIRQLKAEDSDFEMYVMLGAWINCEGAWTAAPDHNAEDEEGNAAEIQRAVDLAINYSDIVKVIAVGNEAMVKWAASYFVQAKTILRWVNHLQKLKMENKLAKGIWITSSDNFASWGGGDAEYHTEDLEKLINAVDFISMHTYPMHDTHYNPDFWGLAETELQTTKEESISFAMEDAIAYAKNQYMSVQDYVKGLGISKPIHIGETGWASSSNGFYGDEGSKACDEIKEALYYHGIRAWTKKEGISCFYFEAFDETWKDGQNPGGSENHFGLFTIEGKAKYALWDLVDQGVFKNLKRGGKSISKTHNGDKSMLLEKVKIPIVSKEKTEIK